MAVEVYLHTKCRGNFRIGKVFDRKFYDYFLVRFAAVLCTEGICQLFVMLMIVFLARRVSLNGLSPALVLPFPHPSNHPSIHPNIHISSLVVLFLVAHSITTLTWDSFT